eukprot:CAMPEP_0114512746 /NCGR_PEP_ID=MMETSP0109-20121206/15158_1 /TAXON_ID=29199 /ORGANISM="Chlorarachnion reptans, Strain CCCM449" /LENGTH=858 /DNA_ID=CAMNT_0001692487 /DNA_START=13 /DNA_END=2589 /DNA_ORIENTATION=+
MRGFFLLLLATIPNADGLQQESHASALAHEVRINGRHINASTLSSNDEDIKHHEALAKSMTFKELVSKVETFDMTNPDHLVVAIPYHRQLAKLANEVEEIVAPTTEQIIAQKIKAVETVPEFQHCTTIMSAFLGPSEPMSNFLGPDDKKAGPKFQDGIQQLVEACQGDTSATEENLSCEHMGSILEIIYYMKAPIYKRNTTTFCLMMVDSVIATEEEPQCMRYMELVTMRHYKDTGKYHTWPEITKTSGFDAAFLATCTTEDNDQSDCNTSLNLVKALPSNVSAHAYVASMCQSLGVPLVQDDTSRISNESTPETIALVEISSLPLSPKPSTRLHSERGRISHLFHLAAEHELEKASKMSLEDEKDLFRKLMADAMELTKGEDGVTNITYEEEENDVDDEEIGRLLAERQSIFSEKEDFENALSRKHRHRPHRHSPHRHSVYWRCTSSSTSRYAGSLCGKRAYTHEVSAGASAGLALGASLATGHGYGFPPSGYPGSGANPQNGHHMGQMGSFGSVAFGVETNIGAGVNKVNGYINHYNSIEGYAKVVGASGGPWIFSVGGGTIFGCQTGWVRCSKVIGGYTEFGVGISLLPVSVTALNVRTWKIGRPCSLTKKTSSCPKCFPAAATVQTPDGELRMEDLRVGDKVLTTSSEGVLAYEPVTFFGHAHAEQYMEAVRLHLDGNAEPLELSAKHFVPVCPEATPCDFKRGEYTYKYAQNVNVGDYMWIAGTGLSTGTKITLAKVSQISSSIERGMFNPYTEGGKIVVNNVLASSHSNWILDDVVPESLSYMLPDIYQTLFSFVASTLHFVFGEYEIAANLLDVNSPMRTEDGHAGTMLTWAAGFSCAIAVAAAVMPKVRA